MAGLITHVHVFDDAGERHVFGPGDDVPAWAAEKITNPDAWDQASETGPAAPGPAAGPPPRTGAGSSRDAWATYAADHGVEVAADAKRDEIIAVLEEAGVPITGEGEE